VRHIKKLALKMLPPGSHLRELILQEPDEVPVESLPVRIGLWLRLNTLEAQDVLRGTPSPTLQAGAGGPEGNPPARRWGEEVRA
jgi:hypothetical protein